MSALQIDGEETFQAIGDTRVRTGNKVFGGSDATIAYAMGNPHLIAQKNLKYAGLVVLGLLSAYVIYKKVK